MSPLIGLRHGLHQHSALGATVSRQVSREVRIICCYILWLAVSTDETSYEAGIKVQIHSQDEPPFIDQLGFGVAPGFQTFVSCQQQLVSNIQPPPLQPQFLFEFSLRFILCLSAKSTSVQAHHLPVGICPVRVPWLHSKVTDIVSVTQWNRADIAVKKNMNRAGPSHDWMQYYSLCLTQPKKTSPPQHAIISGGTDVYFYSLYF